MAHAEMPVKQDWAEKLDSLNKQEREVHLSQLRLIREQTLSFVRDLAAIRLEVTTQKSALSKFQAEVSMERLASLEASNQAMQQQITHISRQVEDGKADCRAMVEGLTTASRQEIDGVKEQVKSFRTNVMEVSNQVATATGDEDLQQRVQKLEALVLEMSRAQRRAHEECLAGSFAAVVCDGRVTPGTTSTSLTERDEQEADAFEQRLTKLDAAQSRLKQDHFILAQNVAALRESHKQVHDSVAEMAGFFKDLDTTIGDPLQAHKRHTAERLSTLTTDVEELAALLQLHQSRWMEQQRNIEGHFDCVYAKLSQRPSEVGKAVEEDAKKSRKIGRFRR